MRFLTRRWRYVLGTLLFVALVLAAVFPNGPEPSDDALRWVAVLFAWAGAFTTIWLGWRRYVTTRQHVDYLRRTLADVRDHSERANLALVEANVKIAEVAERLASVRPIAPNPTRPEKR